MCAIVIFGATHATAATTPVSDNAESKLTKTKKKAKKGYATKNSIQPKQLRRTRRALLLPQVIVKQLW